MKRVLFVGPLETNGRYKGGIASFLSTIVLNKERFKSEGFDLFFFNTCRVKRKDSSTGKLRFENIKNFFIVKKDLKKEITSGNYDIIYFNTSIGLSLLKDLLTIKTNYKKRSKIIFHIHSASISQVFTKCFLLKRMILNQLKTKASKIVTLSKKFKKALFEVGFSKENIKVLYNFFSPNLSNVSEDFLINKITKSDGKNYLFIGTYNQNKGFYDLIKLFENKDLRDYKLSLCGSPIEHEAEIILKNLPENIKNFGFVSGKDKESVFKNNDILLLPSYNEGLPIVLLEALHFGLPVITTNVGAIPEIITQNTGAIINPGKIEELKKEILYFSANKSMILTKSINCLKTSKYYTFDIFFSNLIKILAC